MTDDIMSPESRVHCCGEHSGIQVSIKNLEKKVCAQTKKIDAMYARINVVLGSACLSLLLIIIDIVIRFNHIKPVP